MLMENLVYHYTSLDALDGIIGKDNITFWATRYGYLNDIFEKVWSQDYIQSIIKKDLEGTDHSFDIINDLIDRHPYIISFCDIPDYRNMWRLYCNDGLGICICLDSCVLNKIAYENRFTDPGIKQDYFEHVFYCSRKDVPNAINFWQNSEIFNINRNDPDDNIYAMSAFVKCDDYDIENEVRYVRIRDNSPVTVGIDKNSSKIISTPTEDKKDVKYRMRNNEKVPYLEIVFPSEAIKKIIVGYRYDFENAKQCIKQVLSKNSVLVDIEIEKSTINDK